MPADTKQLLETDLLGCAESGRIHSQGYCALLQSTRMAGCAYPFCIRQEMIRMVMKRLLSDGLLFSQ